MRSSHRFTSSALTLPTLLQLSEALLEHLSWVRVSVCLCFCLYEILCGFKHITLMIVRYASKSSHSRKEPSMYQLLVS